MLRDVQEGALAIKWALQGLPGWVLRPPTVGGLVEFRGHLPVSPRKGVEPETRGGGLVRQGVFLQLHVATDLLGPASCPACPEHRVMDNAAPLGNQAFRQPELSEAAGWRRGSVPRRPGAGRS